MGMETGIVGAGLFGFIFFILDCIAILEIIESKRSVCKRLIWCVFIFFVQPFGVICYFLFASRIKHTNEQSEPLLQHPHPSHPSQGHPLQGHSSQGHSSQLGPSPESLPYIEPMPPGYYNK